MSEDSNVRAEALADLALKFAQDSLSDCRDQLLAAADGDRAAMRRAADILRRSGAKRPAGQRAAQHVAFAMVTSLFAQSMQTQS